MAALALDPLHLLAELLRLLPQRVDLAVARAAAAAAELLDLRWLNAHLQAEGLESLSDGQRVLNIAESLPQLLILFGKERC